MLYSSSSRENDFFREAGKVCSNIISEYGSCRLEYTSIAAEDHRWSIAGISHIQYMDFNADGDDELLVCYNNNGKYIVEIWGFSKDEFVNIYKTEANSIESYPNLGSWITIYRSGGKYYLAELKENSTEEMDILSLTKKGFTAVSSCTFSPVNESYTVDEQINALDFETIKLSALPAAQAEYIQGSVNRSVSEFISETHIDSNALKTEAAKRANAYVKLIESKNQKYGKASVGTSTDKFFANGSAIIRLIDFNGDSNEELLIISRNKKHFDDSDASPKYVVEVFAWNGSTVQKIFEEGTASAYFGNEKRDAFFIMQKKDGKVNICTNTYSYGNNPESTWRGVSKINEMTSASAFETTFTAISNKSNGYTTCRIDGKSVSISEFNKNGKIVPYFCNDEEYNKNEFEIILLRGGAESKAEIEKAVSASQETIKQLKSVYETDGQ